MGHDSLVCSFGLNGVVFLCLFYYHYVLCVSAPVKPMSANVSFVKIFCNPQSVIISLSIVTGTYIWSILEPTLEPYLRKVCVILNLIKVVINTDLPFIIIFSLFLKIYYMERSVFSDCIQVM